MTLLQLARECPSELEADMQQEFGINLRSIDGVGVAHVAALAPSLLVNGTRVAAHFDPAYGWTRDQILAASIVDQLRLLQWGIGGGKGPRPKSVIPTPGDSKKSGEGVRRIGIAVPIDRIDELFGLNDREVADG